MNQTELKEMNSLREKAEQKIPKYESEIKKLKDKLIGLEAQADRNNPDIIVSMKDCMIQLVNKFPKVKFIIESDFGYKNSFKLRTSDICPL